MEHKEESNGTDKDDEYSDPRAFRRSLRLSEEPRVKEGHGHRPVDVDLLWKYVRQELDTALQYEVSQLITNYAEWRDQYAQVLDQRAQSSENE